MTKKLFDLDRQHPQIMGILNVTPDSFSDGGHCYIGNKLNIDSCRWRVESMLSDGATIIDVGGESTRPGAKPVSLNEEMDRVLPVIEAISSYDVVISLDSSSPEVIYEATKLGIGLINDVRALQRENALEIAAAAQIPVCLMHMQGQPDSMQDNPCYHDLLEAVEAFFVNRIKACLDAGIARENLLLDPGFGFGKTLEHNIAMLQHLAQFTKYDCPLLVGFSRKSMVSNMLGGRALNERMAGSIALAVLAIERGAWILRAHDVKETVDAVTIAAKILEKSHG